MNKILSWKIGNGVYAYVYPVNNDNTHVAKKIPENSPLWDSIISEISTWDKNKYTSNFDKMAKEVKEKYAIEIPRDIDKYWGFTSDGSNVNIVLLSGDDGVGNSDDSSENITTEDINEILDKIKDEAYARQSAITQYVLTEANKTITDAKNEISGVKEHLDNIKEELGGKLSAATDAINATKKLFDDGDITPEKINDALATISEHGDWVAASSGFITSIRNGADEATQQIGGIADAEDPVRGYFSTIASNINALSGTVGSVSQTVDASQGKIEDMASWYDTNVSAATNAISYINASAGTIGDTLEYINGSGLTTYLNREMDARAMTIKDTIETDFEDSITSVNRLLDGFSGVIKDTVVKYNETEGKLISLGDEMDATNRRMAKYMNITDDTQKEVMDFRETWTEASGMLRTVGKLIYVEDADGNATGKVFPKEDMGKYYDEYYVHEKKDVILKKGADNWTLEDGTIIPDLIVSPNLSQVLGSFISQTASNVAFGVASASGTIAQIALEISEGANGEGESYINMIANKVQISGELIANSLSTSKANIGGILIGQSAITCEVNSEETFKIDGETGVVYANDIVINGGSISGFEILSGALKYDTLVINANNEQFSSGEEKLKLISGFKEKFKFYELVDYTNKNNIIYIQKTKEEFANEDIYSTIYLKKEDGSYEGIENYEYYVTTFKSLDEGSPIINNIGHKHVLVFILNDDIKNISGGTYNYNNKVIDIEGSKLNPVPITFSLSEEGVVKCKKIISKDSFLEGSINAYGNFKGKLDNVDGVIKDVIIHKTEIDDIILNNSFNCYESNDENTFLTINKLRNDYLTSDNNNTQYFYVNNINIYEQNDSNSYKDYKNGKFLIKIPVKGNYNITIPKIKFNILRNAPTNNSNLNASLTVSYKIDNNIVASGSTTLLYPYRDGPQQEKFEIEKTNITGSTKEFNLFSIYLEYNINLAPSDYKTAYFKITSEIDNKITVEKTPIDGDVDFHIDINPGALYVNCNSDKKILFDEDGIKLYHKGSTYDLFELLGLS